MRIGTYKFIIKPLLFLIVGAIPLGLIATLLTKNMGNILATDRMPAYGLAHPEKWECELRRDAQATLTMDTAQGAHDVEKTRMGYALIDTDQGVTVQVIKPGATSDSVYLRNIINVTGTYLKGTLHFVMEARSNDSFPVIITIRGTSAKVSKPLWSTKFDVSKEWQPYSASVPVDALTKEPNLNLVIAVHLGSKAGKIDIRHIYLR